MKRITIFTILMLMVAFTAQAQKPKTGNARTTTTNKTQAAPSLLGTWEMDISTNDDDFSAGLYITFAPGNVVLIKVSFDITSPVSDAGDEIRVLGDVSAYGSYKKSGDNITILVDQNSVTTESDVHVFLSDETKAKFAEKDMNESNYEKKLEKEVRENIDFSKFAKIVTEINGKNLSVKSLTAKTLVLDGKDDLKLNFERAEEKQKNYPDGRKYVGEIDDTDPFGNGTMTWRNGDKYVGEFFWGDREGLGLMIYANGDKYVGQWKDGERSGKGTMTYKNGRVEKGIWKDGKLVSRTFTNSQTTKPSTTQPQSPIVTKTYANGDKYVGQMKDDKRNGQGTFTWANGSKYVGEWKDDKENGKGTFTSPDGSKFVGEYKDGKATQGTYTFAWGDKYVGGYKNGYYNGQGTYTYADGRKYVGEYKDGSKNGKGTMTYPDGRVEKGIWKDNKLVERQ